MLCPGEKELYFNQLKWIQMIWNNLRKLSLMQRPEMDTMTQNANETLEKLINEFESAENITKSLHQAAKKLPDHILCTGKFETKLSDELLSSNLFAHDEFMRGIIDEWHSFAFVSNTIGDEYVITTQKTLIEPLRQLKQAFGELRTAIRLHDSIQFDVIKFQRKVASYSEKEKTGANLVKLEETKQALAASQREFARRTQLLINDLSKFLKGSVDMMKPLLEGFIAAEVAWIRACKKTIDSKPSISSITGGHSVNGELGGPSARSKAIDEKIQALSSLTICSELR